MRWPVLVVATTVVAGSALAGSVMAGDAAVAAEPLPRAERVLVVAYPRLTWALVDEVRPPALLALLGRSATGSMSVQAASDHTDAADGYLTLGAGNRADAGRVVLGIESRAGEVMVPAVEQLDARNDDLLYGARVGALGGALREAGRSAALVANADVVVPVGTVDHREAALAMMDIGGRAGGSVMTDLARIDPSAPGQRRMDTTVVLEAFAEVWAPGAAVLVEMSDLDRADRAGTPADLADALRRSDELLTGLLATVDPLRDAVLVVAPVAPDDAAQLTVFALAAPGQQAGRARSGTTRRSGYVTLPDVAPTVLELLGAPVPDSMTGTAVITGEGSPVDVAAWSERDARSRFRERAAVNVGVTFLVLHLVVYGALALTFRSRRARLPLQIAMLALLSFPAMTFLSGPFRYDRLGLWGYIAVLVAAAVVVAVLLQAAFGRRDLLAPSVAVGGTWLLLVVDAARGGSLQLDTPFGYSPIVAARFAGMGNLGFTLLMVTAIVVTTGLWPRWPGVGVAPQPRPISAPRELLALAATVFAVSVVVDGLPTMGADLGGVLAMVPALAVCWLVLAGRRVSWPRLAVLFVGAVATVTAFAALDLARPRADRTHLGRFAQRVLDGDASLILRRKISTNLHVLVNPGIVLATAVGLVAAIVAWRRSQPFAEVRRKVPGVQAALLGAAVGAVLGFAVNDSGIVVAGMMLAVLVPWFAHLAFALFPATASRDLVADKDGAAAGGSA